MTGSPSSALASLLRGMRAVSAHFAHVQHSFVLKAFGNQRISLWGMGRKGLWKR